MKGQGHQILKACKVTDLIPQQDPIIMVDSLVSYSDDSVVSEFKIDPSNIFVLNGVLTEPGLIENMAQTVALHTGSQYKLKNETPPTGYIGAIKDVEVMQLPAINEQLTTKAIILHEFMGVTLVNISVTKDGNEIAKGQMKTVIAN